MVMLRSNDPIAELHPRLARVWEQAKAEWSRRHPNGPIPIITDGWRSSAEQDAAYARGDSKARAGESNHNTWPSRAMDVGFVTAAGAPATNVERLREFNSIVRTIDSGIGWGGNWRTFFDPYHFEIPGNPNRLPNTGGGSGMAGPVESTYKPMNANTKKLVILGVATILIILAYRMMKRG
jgi:peptidoglycan LD-endopeptidase CwlK